jgi:hypothetical protein
MPPNLLAPRRSITFGRVLAAGVGCLLIAAAPASPAERRLDARAFARVPGERAPVDYYEVVEEPAGPAVRALYRPGLEALKRGIEVPENERRTWRWLRWRWRALALPDRGDECDPDRGDSAASVYVGWRRGLRWYALKYSWSAVGTRGAVCAPQRNPFLASDTLIRETGGPLGVWITEQVDLDAEFRRHFADGDPRAEVPDLIGIALLTDGDQTHSPAAAEYADFVLSQFP